MMRRTALLLLVATALTVSGCRSSQEVVERIVVQRVVDTVKEKVVDTLVVTKEVHDSVLVRVTENSYVDSNNVHHNDKYVERETHHSESDEKYRSLERENKELRSENEQLKLSSEKEKVVEKPVVKPWPFVVAIVSILSALVYVKIRLAGRNVSKS
ncbi:MAG: hypothetical protein KBT28_04610 [Bacteroidales bacterium]|nr:hypothetical protein [Candidatus Colimorpha merdihippi]